MNHHFLLSIVLLSSIACDAQSFNDCAAEFRKQWGKIQLDAATQKRNDQKMDSLFRALETAFDGCILGNELPAFNLTTTTGKSYTNQDLTGKVVYLNIWTLNCGHCFVELPVLNEIEALYHDNKDVLFLSLLLDSEEDRVRTFQKMQKLVDINFDVVASAAPFGNKDLKKSLPMPTHLFIDKNGKIATKLTGAFNDPNKQEARLRAAIDELLAK